MNDDQFMRVDAEAAFTYDARGRMLLTNEPCMDARRPAPRLFVGRTLMGLIVRVGASVPDMLAEQVLATLSRERSARDLREPLAGAAALRSTLAPVETATAGPSYRFPESLVAPRAGAEVIPLTLANRDLAAETYLWLYDEIRDWQPCFAVVRDGAAVSICFSSRVGARAAAAGVDTRAEFRGRGYASAVTAAWAAAVRATGRMPFYGTAWDNLASQGVARRLGLVMFGAQLTWT